MDYSEIGYAFGGEPWTVGRLRRALADLDDDTPVTVLAEYEPGMADSYAIVDGGPLSEKVVAAIRPASEEFVLLCAMHEAAEEDV